jgi:hypothetical protein
MTANITVLMTTLYTLLVMLTWYRPHATNSALFCVSEWIELPREQQLIILANCTLALA